MNYRKHKLYAVYRSILSRCTSLAANPKAPTHCSIPKALPKNNSGSTKRTVKPMATGSAPTARRTACRRALPSTLSMCRTKPPPMSSIAQRSIKKRSTQSRRGKTRSYQRETPAGACSFPRSAWKCRQGAPRPPCRRHTTLCLHPLISHPAVGISRQGKL